jgi:hypothetical protein
MCVSHQINALCEGAREFAQEVQDGTVRSIGPFNSGGSVAHLLSLLHNGSVRPSSPSSLVVAGNAVQDSCDQTKQARALPLLPDLSPEALAPEGSEERSGRGGVVLHLMGKKRVLSGPYRTANLQLDVFSWSTSTCVLSPF